MSTRRLSGARARASATRFVECRDARCGARRYRSGRHGIHPNAAGPQLGCEVAHARLERRLHGAHDSVVRHDLAGTVVAHGEERAAAVHQGLRETRHLHERMTRDAHRAARSLRASCRRRGRGGPLRARKQSNAARSPVGPSVRESPRTRVPSAPGCSTSSGSVSVASSSRASGSTCGRALVVEPRHRELRADRAEHARAAVSDALIVGDADDESFAADEGLAERYQVHVVSHGPKRISRRAASP